MAILKLQIGKPNAISGVVSSVEAVEGRFGAQYRVTFDTGDDLYLPKDGFDRQIQRMNKQPEELAGETVTFWKKPVDGDVTGTKGYLNIDLGNTAPANRVAAAALNDDYVGRDLRARGVPLSATTYEQIKDQFVECLGDAIAILREVEETMGFTHTPAEVVAVAHGLKISREKAGV